MGCSYIIIIEELLSRRRSINSLKFFKWLYQIHSVVCFVNNSIHLKPLYSPFLWFITFQTLNFHHASRKFSLIYFSNNWRTCAFTLRYTINLDIFYRLLFSLPSSPLPMPDTLLQQQLQLHMPVINCSVQCSNFSFNIFSTNYSVQCVIFSFYNTFLTIF